MKSDQLENSTNKHEELKDWKKSQMELMILREIETILISKA